MPPASTDADHSCVVFVHGLWMNGMELAWLRRRVARCGYATARFSYPTVSAGVDDNAARLRAFVERIPTPVVHLVGHSLGGVVILRMLMSMPDRARIGRVVLLGPPLNGSGVARRLAGFGLGKRMLGQSLPGGLAGPALVIAPDIEVGVIAGCSNVGLGRVVGGIRAPSDGTVAVAETRLEGLTDHRVLAVSHLGMVLSVRVATEVCHFLRHGAFGASAPS